MAVATYGQQNPAGTDPWPIETSLAQTAYANDPQLAASALNVYQHQRAADTANYQTAMQAQHDFAYKQLAQQLAEAKMKAAGELLGKPGGEMLLGTGGIDTGYDPTLLGQVQTEAQQAQQAKNLEASGKGIEGASAGGVQIAPDNVPGFQGLTTTNLGYNARVQAELIRQQTELQKASMRGAGGGKSPSDSYPIKYGTTDDGQLVVGQLRIPRNATPEQVQQIIARARAVEQQVNPSRSNVPGMTPPSAGVPSAPTPGGGLPPAQTDSGGAPASPPPTRVAPVASGRVPGLAPAPAQTQQPAQFIRDPRAQALAQQGARLLPPGAQADVRANTAGSVLPIMPDGKGGAVYVGKSGRTYSLAPGQTQ